MGFLNLRALSIRNKRARTITQLASHSEPPSQHPTFHSQGMWSADEEDDWLEEGKEEEKSVHDEECHEQKTELVLNAAESLAHDRLGYFHSQNTFDIASLAANFDFDEIPEIQRPAQEHAQQSDLQLRMPTSLSSNEMPASHLDEASRISVSHERTQPVTDAFRPVTGPLHAAAATSSAQQAETSMAFAPTAFIQQQMMTSSLAPLFNMTTAPMAPMMMLTPVPVIPMPVRQQGDSADGMQLQDSNQHASPLSAGSALLSQGQGHLSHLLQQQQQPQPQSQPQRLQHTHPPPLQHQGQQHNWLQAQPQPQPQHLHNPPPEPLQHLMLPQNETKYQPHPQPQTQWPSQPQPQLQPQLQQQQQQQRSQSQSEQSNSLETALPTVQPWQGGLLPGPLMDQQLFQQQMFQQQLFQQQQESMMMYNPYFPLFGAALAQTCAQSSDVAGNNAEPSPPPLSRNLPPPMDPNAPPQSLKPAKKDSDRPKRALTAYNIFFQHERARMLGEEIPNLDDSQLSSSTSLSSSQSGVAASTGIPARLQEAETKGSNETDNLSLQSQQQYLPSRSRKSKPKRAPHGKISFEEMARQIGKNWKNADDAVKAKYDALAAQDRERHSREMVAYKAKKKREADDTARTDRDDGQNESKR